MKRRAVIATGSRLLAGVGVLALAGCIGEERLDERGDIDVVIDGETVDLSADRFQSEYVENDTARFHLHEGDDRWFMEGVERVTVAEAIDLLPHFAYDDDDGDRVVTVDGTAYDDGDPETEITFLVDDEAVDPDEHELHHGEYLRVEIETGA